MEYLNKAIADAICTIILAGYVKIDGAKTQFQYADDAEKKDYLLIQGGLKQLGVNLDVSLSRSQSDMPYILAKTPKIPNIDYAKALTLDYWKYLQAITKSANSLNTAPYGAYIGGMSTISSLFIVGPSSLDQYTPQFRPADDTNIKTSYNNAVSATNAALACIKQDKPTAKPTGINVNFSDLNSPITVIFQNGKLFKSYHGMIQAIVNYQTVNDSSKFFFEIALGNNTSKVSSCFPCCTLMTANNTPPTSTHLGRGDNWNIPSNCAVKGLWEAKIKSYYLSGKESLGNLSNVKGFISTLQANGAETQIPAVFLEALTFESKFTDKVKLTLNLK